MPLGGGGVACRRCTRRARNGRPEAVGIEGPKVALAEETDDHDVDHVSSGAQRGSVVWLALTRAVLVLSGIAVQLVLVWWLGDAGYGMYSTVMSVTVLFGVFSHLNLQLLLAREVARKPERAPGLLGEGLAAVSLASVPAIALVLGYILIFDGRAQVLQAGIPASLGMLALSLGLVLQGVLQGLRRMRSFPVANLLGRGALLGGTLAVLSLGLGLTSVFWVQTASLLLTAGVMLVAFSSGVRLPRLPRPQAVVDLVRTSVPFALNRLYGAVYLASDVLVVAFFHPDAEVGLYRVASLLLIQLAVVSGVLVDAIYPAMARAAGDARALGDQISFGVRILLLVSVPIAVGGMCTAYGLVDLVLEPAFRAAVPAMLVLLPILPVRFIIKLVGNAMSAVDRQPERTRATLYAAVLNVGANLALVPVLGALGAAITTLITEIALCAFLAWRLSSSVEEVRVLGPVLRIGAAAGLMAAVVLALAWLPFPVHVLVQVVVGMVVFVPASWLLGTWRIGDLRRMARI